MTDVLKQYCNFLILVVSLVVSNAVIAEDIRIALRAHKGAQKGLEQWQATADYLSEKIPGYRFIMVPFENNSALNQAVSRGEFHFSLTNPAAAVEHKIRYGAQPIATLVNKRQGKGYSRFGSVIFTRADRKDINELKDLKGKIFIGVDELGFGGWRVAWQELLKNDINPYADFKEVRFAGGKQQKVVYAVRDGNVDAGSVRTDMLERLAASGTINLDDFKVIGNKKTEGFPFLHSTELYPEWLFSSVRKMDSLAERDSKLNMQQNWEFRSKSIMKTDKTRHFTSISYRLESKIRVFAWLGRSGLVEQTLILEACHEMHNLRKHN